MKPPRVALSLICGKASDSISINRDPELVIWSLCAREAIVPRFSKQQRPLYPIEAEMNRFRDHPAAASQRMWDITSEPAETAWAWSTGGKGTS